MSIANLPPLSGTIVVDSGIFDVFVELASGADLIIKSPDNTSQSVIQQVTDTQLLIVNEGDGTAVASEIIFQAKNSAGVNKQMLTMDGDNLQVGGVLFVNSTQTAGEYATLNTYGGTTDIVSDTRNASPPVISTLNLFCTDDLSPPNLVPVLQTNHLSVTIPPTLYVGGDLNVTGSIRSGDAPVMAGWAFQSVPSSTLTTIYTSPTLGLGVYLVTACVQVSAPNPNFLDAVNIYFVDETSHQTPAGFACYDGTTWNGNASQYTTAVTTFLNITSTSDDFFTIQINCKTSDNNPYSLSAQGVGLGDGGVKWMKIA